MKITSIVWEKVVVLYKDGTPDLKLSDCHVSVRESSSNREMLKCVITPIKNGRGESSFFYSDIKVLRLTPWEMRLEGKGFDEKGIYDVIIQAKF